MQRAADFASHDLGFGDSRLGQRRLGHDVSITPESPIERLDPRELGGGRFHRRNLARLDTARYFGKFEEVEG